MLAKQLDTVLQNLPVQEPKEDLVPMDPAIKAALHENHSVFLQFLTRRLGNKGVAEDVLQSFYLRVVRKGLELRDSESAIAWLYSVLRSVLLDHYRSEAARQRREAGYAQEQALLGNDHVDPELVENLCNCFQGLLPTLRPEYADVLLRIDLSGATREDVAADLNITPTNVRVRLHRARQALRKALNEFCGRCCKSGFRDCDCKSTDSEPMCDMSHA